MIPEPEFVDFSDPSLPLVADERWLREVQNGNGVPSAAVDSGWIPKTLANTPETPPTAPELGGLGILYRGRRHVFSGPQESAKTLAAYICGICVLREGSSIVLVDFEMGEWEAARRFRELGATDQELERVSYVEPQTPPTPLAISRLIETKPALVIVDAAAGAFSVNGLDDNARKDVELWANAWIAPFWRAEIATLVLDHVTKNVETRGNYAIGSERKVGSADVHIGFSVIDAVKRGGTGRYKITTHKDRGGFLRRGKLGELALRSDPDTHSIEWAIEPYVEADDEHPFRPTVKMEQASRWLEREMAERVPMREIENGVAGDRNALRIAIQLLLDEGYFSETKGSRNARLITLVRPYREEYDELSASSLELSGPGDETSSLALCSPYRGQRRTESSSDGPESSQRAPENRELEIPW